MLVSLVYSGNKSIHSVIRVDAPDLPTWNRYRTKILSLYGTDPDPRYRLEAVNILSEGGLTAEAETTLNTYLRDQPNDVEAWLKMAILKDARGQVEQAQSAIIQAYKIDRNAFAQLVSANEQLQRIAAPLFQKR